MSRTVKRLLIGAGAVAGLLVATLLVAPAFIDMNAYRPEIIKQVKQATGLELAIDGPISLRLLPTPTVRVDNIKSPKLVEVKSVTVRPVLLALLTGDIEPSEVVLAGPKAALEINKEGAPNWPAALVASGAQSRAPRSLGQLVVEDGALTFTDAQTGLSMTVEKANFVASVGSLEGPYVLSGSATVNGSPVKGSVTVGAKGPSGYPADLSMQAGGGGLSFRGMLSELGPQGKATGKVSATADNLIAFVETLAKIGGQPRPLLQPLLAGKFSFEGDVEASQAALTSKDFKLSFGEDMGSGSATIALKPALVVDASFAAKRLDLDRWLASIRLPEQAPTLEPVAPLDSAPKPQPAPPPSLLQSITGKVGVEVGELIYNKKPIRDIAVELEVRSGVVAVPRFNAVAPGDLRMQARSTMSGDATRPSVLGEFSLLGTNPRETFAWLDIDVSSVPSDKLKRVSMTGKLTSSGGNVEVKEAAFELDGLKGTGGIVVGFTVPLSAVLHLEFNTLDLDSYLPPDAQLSSTATTSSAGSGIPILALLGPAVGLKVKIGKVVYRGDQIAGVDIDVARDRGTLKLNDFKVADLAGARVALRGAVANYWANDPRADFVFSFDAPDLNRVLKLAGQPQASAAIAVRVSGSLAGTPEQVALREVVVSSMGSIARVTGTLSMPGASQGPPKSASYRGSLTINGQTVEVSVDVTLADKPNVVAAVKAGFLDLNKVGSPAQPQAAADQPVDTAPLRRVDGTFKFSAETLITGPLQIGNADLAATLKDGVLTVSYLKGSLSGGALNLSGTVNGTQPALSFEFHGDVEGIPVGGLLRTATGTNVFGSIINVSIDGSLNANGITLRGGGATSAQIRSSLAGGARLNGSVRASADRFLQVLGSAATGAVGGVIDTTLGNLMSLAGEKGGVGIANLLNAISLVLHRFVNNNNAISGQVDVAGGILTANGLAVQGSGATANVSTHTNLANATTQTTIAFMIAEDPSAPYLITTASGPLSALSFHATRGSAKDPAGIASMIPTINPSSLIPNISVPHIPLPSIPNPFR